MISLRCTLLLAGWVILLPGCSNETETELPIAGVRRGSDDDAQRLYNRAQAADKSGRGKKAISLYSGTADKYPHSRIAAAARFRQAQLLHQQGKLDAAFEIYQMVISRYQASSLYTQARDSQAKVAHAAAEGSVTGKLLWFKPDLDIKKVVSMLETVRDNAPRAPSAAKAQHAIGKAYEGRKWKSAEAVSAYQKVVDEYPRSPYAPEAQFKIGKMLMAGASKGNQDNSNLDRALNTFADLRQSYPNSKSAAEATKMITEIRTRDLQRTFDIAEFYFKKGQKSSARVYYREVVRKTGKGNLHDRARSRLQSLQDSE